jgi:L-fucose isomerase
MDGSGQQEIDNKPVIKPFWMINEGEVKKCCAATTWHPATVVYFRGGGFSTNYLTRGGMPVTMIRINIIKGLGLVLQLAEGWTVDLPDNIHKILNIRTDPTWPTTWFAPRLTGKGAFKSVYDVMNNWGANHGSLCYGHIGADLITLASMLRIPVCMHNIAEEKIFRPSAWNAFGTSDLEGADFRACTCFGPLYR